ncbi:MAG: peptidase T [Oscillospiraceae bacterium]
MKAYERLIRYAEVSTASAEDSGESPTTARQFDLARLLAGELLSLGVSDVEVSDSCYVYAHLPATAGLENAPCLGLIAHMDTSPDFSGENVKPRIIENYDGEDVPLGTSGRVLTHNMFPSLRRLKGRTLIVTDGTTLLGADDKAGIAEIMTLLEKLIDDSAPHGRISVCFTPDEEVGCGTAHFDLKKLGADFAYTLDGEEEGEVVFENFNACAATVTFSGVNLHPGSSKDAMVNAGLVAMEFNAMLPAGDTPRNTEGYEGFFHLISMSGTVEKSETRYIVRDHDAAKFEQRKDTLMHIEKLLNAKYGANTVRVALREQYRNMAEKIRPSYYHLVDNAIEATRAAGVEPILRPIRGGTDGAQLSWEGLPCPNLGTGGFGFHGPYEHISVEGMDKAVEILQNIVSIYAK